MFIDQISKPWQTIITTAIPSITNEFHSLEDVGWYGSAMFFPLAATQSVWGKAYKYFPVKHVFLLGIVIFEIGSLICGNGTSRTQFSAAQHANDKKHLHQTAMPSLPDGLSRAQAVLVSLQAASSLFLCLPDRESDQR